MNFDDIFNNFDPHNSKNSYRDLSFFLEKLLEHNFEKQNIRYHQLSAPIFHFDYILEDVLIPELPTPTAVEMKIIPSAFAVSKILDNFLNQKEKFTPKPKSLIIITTLSEHDINRLFKDKNFEFPYKICGKEYINKLIIENIDYSKNLLSNLYNIKFEEIFSNKNSEQNWKEERSKRIAQLKLKYKDGNFSLLLGAGVSCDAKLPSWEQLISSLLIKYFSETQNADNKFSQKSINTISNNFKENYFNSALLSARYLKKSFTKSNEPSDKFKNIIHEILYKTNKINRSSKLIEIIGQLCIPTRLRAHVDSIITYNFDDLIEQKLNNLNLQYHVIPNDLETYSIKELPIYHVHGFIPEHPNKYDDYIGNEIVFSEDGYHKMYSESYHWSNLVQLTHLREKSCLMIGLSMDDPNLRRLLDIVSNPSIESKHFAILQRVKEDSLVTSLSTTEEMNLSKNFLQSHHQLQEAIFKDLGVNIIWYEEYSDIPEILEMLLN
ncbi:SIR2 family protein [Acinetobacter seifertii]|uniref:SIR2 family protein n=2 Tax=Acinetobacter calcoaceticus/baumannii complex TaxID=909768 RepID=UPI0018DB905A|nr:SIR2 family protein [Acinetobacter seifertii]MDN8284514.1 SIR2 family protein [Acinetobacter baumannii]QPV59972.1 SIR2 family protein [Acinetobacter seifertii]